MAAVAYKYEEFKVLGVQVLSVSTGSRFIHKIWNEEELSKMVKGFQHVRATGEATPSGWQPGKTTLIPGPDLVGKVWKVWKPEMAFE